MFYTIKLKPIAFLPVILLLSVFLMMLIPGRTQPVMIRQEDPCLIIDPGHGGHDSGALSFAGDKESDINLAIGQRLCLLAALYGEKAVMTRSDDRARTDADSYSEHAELVYRCEQINAVSNGILFSIHQNSFPTAQPKGAQVLYAAGEESKRLGILTHANLIRHLEPDNRRVAEPASEKLFITANASCPSILVECGFLSNLSDLQKLKDKDYQTAFSAVLFLSYLQYVQGEGIV